MPKSRILVIDDDAAIRDSLQMTLEYDGYDFVGAATGPGRPGAGRARSARPGAARHQDAGHGRDGRAVAPAIDERDHAGRDDLGPRHDQHGGRGDQARRVRLPRQAVREHRSAARDDRQRARAGPSARREPNAEEGRRSPPPDGRREQRPAAGDGRGRPGRADQRDRAHPGRERRRQGTGRADDSPQQPAAAANGSCR